MLIDKWSIKQPDPAWSKNFFDFTHFLKARAEMKKKIILFLVQMGTKKFAFEQSQ